MIYDVMLYAFRVIWCINHIYYSFSYVQIGEVSKPIILDWVISQHSHILEWSGRAFDIEVSSIAIAVMPQNNQGLL